jgi:hypothetical protein
VSAVVAYYIFQNANCETVINTYLAGMFGIATGYYMGKAESK